MTGGREGSTSDGKDPWREREAIGTQQRPGFGFRSQPLSYLKSVGIFGGFEYRVGGERSNRLRLGNPCCIAFDKLSAHLR